MIIYYKGKQPPSSFKKAERPVLSINQTIDED